MLEDDPTDIELRVARPGATEDADGPEDMELSDEGADHRENLALEMSEGDLARIGSQLAEGYEADLDSRSSLDKDTKDGFRILGLTDDEVDDGPFDGAATATTPLLMEAAAQFWARAMGELFPPEGPIKHRVNGVETDDLRQRGERVERYMNHQCLIEDPDYYDETSKLIWSLPFRGSAFKWTYWDRNTDTLKGVYKSTSDVIVHADARSIATAPRATVRTWEQHSDILRLQEAGEYRQCDLGMPSDDPDADTESDEALRDMDHSESAASDQKETRLILVMYADLDLPGHEHIGSNGEPSGIKLPYIIEMDHQTDKVLSIRRNWSAIDDLQRPQPALTHYKMLPGFGFYGLGFLQAIGKLQQASNGSIRAILDGSATASMQGGFVAKNAAMKSDSYRITPGEWKRTDLTGEELSRMFYTPPFREPSAALFNALQYCDEAARRFSSSTDVMTGAANNKAPVGTTVALIEQGQKIHSAIHQGLHKSAGAEFRIRFRLNGENIPDSGYPYDVDLDGDGEPDPDKIIFREDFGNGVAVIPVSDPNMASSTVRIATAQAVVELASQNPDLYDRREAHARLLEALKVPDVDSVLPDPGEIEPMDPIAENQASMLGKPFRVFPDQDDAAHLRVHLSFMQNPGYGGHPEVAQQIEAQMRAHIAEHLASLYAKQAMAMQIPTQRVEAQGEAQGDMDPMMQAQAALLAAQNAELLTQIPGLPPAQAGPDPEAAKMQREDQKHQQQLQHREQDHAQKIQQAIDKATVDQDIVKNKRISEMVDEQLKKDVEKSAEVIGATRQ